MKAVYFGAGYDFKYFKYLPKEINHFYFIDSQPFSEFGTLTHYKYDTQNINCFLSFILYYLPCLKPLFLKKINGYSRPNFIQNLKFEAIKNDVMLVSQEENKLIFKYENQIITYFINTSVPENLDLIGNDILGFEHIMIMGFCPNKDILEYTSEKPNIWINFHTIVKPDPYFDKFAKVNNEENNITYLLNYQEGFEDNFSSFNLVSETRRHCFNTWEELIDFEN